MDTVTGHGDFGFQENGLRKEKKKWAQSYQKEGNNKGYNRNKWNSRKQ